MHATMKVYQTQRLCTDMLHIDLVKIVRCCTAWPPGDDLLGRQESITATLGKLASL